MLNSRVKLHFPCLRKSISVLNISMLGTVIDVEVTGFLGVDIRMSLWFKIESLLSVEGKSLTLYFPLNSQFLVGFYHYWWWMTNHHYCFNYWYVYITIFGWQIINICYFKIKLFCEYFTVWYCDIVIFLFFCFLIQFYFFVDGPSTGVLLFFLLSYRLTSRNIFLTWGCDGRLVVVT